MTQEQKTKISEHFDELHTTASSLASNVPDDLKDVLRACYLAGADYALDIYSLHWISVEDELPIDYEPVLAVVGGNHFAFVGICINKKTWYCEIQNKATEIIGITHWCHLPQPPVLSNSGKTGKLIDANNMIDHFADISKKVEKGDEE